MMENALRNQNLPADRKSVHCSQNYCSQKTVHLKKKDRGSTITANHSISQKLHFHLTTIHQIDYNNMPIWFVQAHC